MSEFLLSSAFAAMSAPFAEMDQLAELIDEFGKLSGNAQDELLLDVRRKSTR
ncbi:hypothetical protein AB8E26_16380 [Stenotrophomonas rhizophila]|uniref:hypothetical protein n=1 Tax=Stenotrophomonas rhizophila TaxID=216778 RepID=UPI0035130342